MRRDAGPLAAINTRCGTKLPSDPEPVTSHPARPAAPAPPRGREVRDETTLGRDRESMSTA
ncbi:hypothetical protein JYU34_000548 [Plutella xylostella]|uniref:Uncharacterized protein n=1 Tax=Plutella xylostella TaxID=51655 RepID=A0ABQ7R875_PLUXY|nr:hypothetical protein JYU34_000548 [Plutella xylostella]